MVFIRSSPEQGFSLDMKTTLSLVLVLLVGLSYAQTAKQAEEDSEDEGAFIGTTEKPQKYAPAYCWGFRLNCEKRKDHTCCRFPLPPKDGVPPNSLNLIRPAGVRIRPFRLPGSTTKVEKEEKNEEQNQTAEEEEPPQTEATQKTKESPESDNDESPPIAQPQSGSLFRRKPSFSMKKPSVAPEQPANPESEPKRPSFSPIRKPGGFMSKLCTRLVTDCTTQPTHHCCKHKEEDAAAALVTETEPSEKEPTEGEVQGAEEAQETEKLATENQNIPLENKAEYDQHHQAILDQRQDGIKDEEVEEEVEEEGQEQHPSIRDVQDEREGDFEGELIEEAEPTEQSILEDNYPVLDTEDQPENQFSEAPADAGVVPSVTVVDLVSGNLGGVAPIASDYQQVSPYSQQGGEQVEYYEYDEDEFPAYSVGAQKDAILAQPETGVYQKIPAECFTRAYDCNTDPAQLCCSYQ
ncbi:uncharacterized protein LOC131880181 isoform X1 [Tigriopus californicus]|uniref:uncharacterized protein LOC131880181 isoform X1 n=1 Tax=Tigriopus californicus TaxID=6832 RepID=UPI0027DA9F58|nr:uncharacterized protein LOC131880181 isoform X1 [Tigriopus californicus]